MIIMLLKMGRGFPAVAAFAALLVALLSVNASSLSCYVTGASCNANITVFRMSNTTNAHAELPNQNNYGYTVCCNETNTTLGNSCSGNYTTVLRLSNATNAHVENPSYSDYPNSTCLNVSAGGIDCQYTSDCSFLGPLYTCLASMSADTNAHVGDCNAYSTRVCCAYIAQNLTFSLNPSVAWWGDSIYASGRLMSGTTPLSGTGVTINSSSGTICATNTNSSGYYSCTFTAPMVTGAYNYTAYTSQSAISAILTVAANYGVKPVGTTSRGVVSIPVVVQERDGSIQIETVLIMVYR